MNEQEFNQLKQQGYNRIPLMREALADLDTPLSTYLKLANGPYSYLFESVQGGEKWGRYSIIGLPCRKVVRIDGYRVRVFEDNREIETEEVADPLAWVEDFYARYRIPELEALPRFTGGLVGYFGYDTVRYIEPRLGECPNPDQLQTPDILLMVSDEVVVFDNLSGKMHIIIYADPEQDDAFNKAKTHILYQILQSAGFCLLLSTMNFP